METAYVALHAVLGLDVADDGLDGGASFHLAADGLGDPAHLAGDPDPELVRMVVAAVALVDVDAAGLDTGEPFHLGHDGTEGVAVPRVRPLAGPRTGSGVAVQGRCVQHEIGRA